MKNANFTQLVRNICTGRYCQAELVEFINLAQKISLSYLKYQEMLGKRISGEQPNSSFELEDLAIDCIAELFAGDDAGQFPQLKKYFALKFDEAPGMSDAEVLILIRRLVVRKTKQELSRIFRERDPEGAKIVRNVKVAVRSAPELHVFRELGKDFVFYGNGFEIEDEQVVITAEIAAYLRKKLPPIPEEILQQYFLESYHPNDSVAAVIKGLLHKLNELRYFQNYVPLDALVKMVRFAKFEAFRDKMLADDIVLTPADHLASLEMEEYIERVMSKMWSRLRAQYLRTNKLDDTKASIYHKALRDVLYDLIQKKDSSSYYRNLKYYLPHLTQQGYRQQERSVFEYLAKLAKKEFRKYLNEML
jgi:hypothetical protein